MAGEPGMTADASANILDLPVELLETVFNECTIATLARLSAACTQIHALARERAFRILAADPSVRSLNERFRRTRGFVDDGLPGHSPIESLVLHRSMYRECLRNRAFGSGAFGDDVLAAQLKSGFERARPPSNFGALLRQRNSSDATCECSPALLWLVHTLATHDIRLRLELRGALAARLRAALVKHFPKECSRRVRVVDRRPIGLPTAPHGELVNWVTEWTLVLPPLRGGLPPLRLPPHAADDRARADVLSSFQFWLRGLSGRLARTWHTVAVNDGDLRRLARKPAGLALPVPLPAS